MASKYKALAQQKYGKRIFDAVVCGIPCMIGVIYFCRHPGGCDQSSDDWYGGIECEYDILDGGFRPARWLYAKAEKEGKLDMVDSMVCELIGY